MGLGNELPGKNKTGQTSAPTAGTGPDSRSPAGFMRKKYIYIYSFFLTLSPENKKSLLPLQPQVISSHRFVTVTFPSSHLPRLIAGKLLSELRLFKQVSNRQRDEVPPLKVGGAAPHPRWPPVTG